MSKDRVEPRFSVVIPAFNAASTINRTIESVIGQSLSAAEIIVVDDGSEDDIEAILAAYKGHVQYVRQSNQGSAVARQTGSDLATSEYIAYLDADDWWPSDKLENLSSILERERVDFMLADLDRAVLTKDGLNYLPRNTSFFPWAEQIWKRTPAKSGYEQLYRLEQNDGLSLLLQGFPVFPSTMLASKAALESCGGWDARFRRCQDFDIGLRLAAKYPLYFLNKVHATLGIHDGNNDSTSYMIKQGNGDIEVLKAHAEAAESGSIYHQRVLVALSKKYCGLGHVFRKTRDWDNAISCYEKAMRLPGNRFHSVLRYAVLQLAKRF